MPWKEHRDAYNIWLSEIILQQTRVEQGRAYYERFAETYPTVADLAAADDDAVMKLWEGLGYYSRARNLLRAARMVVAEYGGQFPDTADKLRKLPGVGPYTAAAIASFAFGEQVAVVDGNVYRILARYAGNSTPIDSTPGKKLFAQLATDALGDVPAARFNQAIMDFGALICTPKRASCKECPLSTNCRAFNNGQVYELPVKQKTLKRRDRHFHYLVIKDDADRTIIRQRQGKDIWKDLYEFPLIETVSNEVGTQELAHHPDWPEWLPAAELEFTKRSQVYKQQLTHQTIYVSFHTFRWGLMPGSIENYLLPQNKLLDKFAFPRVITKYIEDKTLLLDLF
ncbi:A/G-specific adenine glycosylase [Lewinella sp. 4G2]|nr:A/G-specific adenine glycosylase [Lewinella sp. 4G2]